MSTQPPTVCLVLTQEEADQINQPSQITPELLGHPGGCVEFQKSLEAGAEDAFHRHPKVYAYGATAPTTWTLLEVSFSAELIAKLFIDEILVYGPTCAGGSGTARWSSPIWPRATGPE